MEAILFIHIHKFMFVKWSRYHVVIRSLGQQPYYLYLLIILKSQVKILNFLVLEVFILFLRSS